MHYWIGADKTAREGAVSEDKGGLSNTDPLADWKCVFSTSSQRPTLITFTAWMIKSIEIYAFMPFCSTLTLCTHHCFHFPLKLNLNFPLLFIPFCVVVMRSSSLLQTEILLLMSLHTEMPETQCADCKTNTVVIPTWLSVFQHQWW